MNTIGAATQLAQICTTYAWGIYRRCVPGGPPNNVDNTANSLAALAAAIAWGAVLLTAVAIALGLGWGLLVRYWAQQTARTAAEEWLETTAPKIVTAHVTKLQTVQGAASGSTPGQIATVTNR